MRPEKPTGTVSVSPAMTEHLDRPSMADRMTAAFRIAALLAAMVISFAVERDLAISHGVPPAVAPAVPVAIDLFMIWAARTGRDVALSVSVAVAANVAGVLTAAPLSAVDTWVSAGLHAVFPLVVWRMHRQSLRPATVATADRLTAEDTDARTDDRPGTDTAEDGQQATPTTTEDQPADRAPGTAPVTDPDTAPAPAMSARPARTPGRPAPVVDLDAVRAAVADLTASGVQPSGRALGERLGVSERTARRYLAKVAA